MSLIQEGVFDSSSLGLILSPGEAVALLIYLASGLVLLASSVSAGGAIALRMRTISRDRLRKQRADQWQGAFHRFLYDGTGEDELRSTVGRRSQTDFLDFLLLYVRRLEGEEREETCRLAEPYLTPVLAELDHRSEGRRMLAVQTLGELGLPRYGDHVIAALDDPSPLVAMVAASTLARAETSGYAAEILARLDRFALWRKDFLAAMLVSMGPGATEALRRSLDDDEAPTRVRTVAADALSGLSDPLSADVAARVAGSDVGVELRAATLRLLASVGRAEHLPIVRKNLSFPDLPVRLAAIRALGRFGVEEDLAPLEEAARNDPSPWVAIAAARALREGSGDAVLEALAGSQHPRAALGLQVISEQRSW